MSSNIKKLDFKSYMEQLSSLANNPHFVKGLEIFYHGNRIGKVTQYPNSSGPLSLLVSSFKAEDVKYIEIDNYIEGDVDSEIIEHNKAIDNNKGKIVLGFSVAHMGDSGWRKLTYSMLKNAEKQGMLEEIHPEILKDFIYHSRKIGEEKKLNSKI
ncbi:MAG: hypothetical protein V3U72_01490 [Candidatus Aenigmarchaeota archaeon]